MILADERCHYCGHLGEIWIITPLTHGLPFWVCWRCHGLLSGCVQARSQRGRGGDREKRRRMF